MVDILQTKTSIIKPKPQKQSQMKMRLTISSIVKCHLRDIFMYNFRVLYNFSMVYFSCNYL